MVANQEIKIQSVGELVETLLQALQDKKEPHWYRGQSNKMWSLLPSCYRENITFHEMDLIKRFKQDGTLLLPNPPTKLFEWLFIMRHYGVTTRLLDWTENPLIAAYFATKDCDVDGRIWIIQPIDLTSQKCARSPSQSPVLIPTFSYSPAFVTIIKFFLFSLESQASFVLLL